MNVHLGGRFLALLVGLSGCAPQFAFDEGTTQISCSRQEDCPGDLSCVLPAGASEGRCVRPGGDGVPPALVAGSVATSRLVVGVGAEVDVTFQASEPLLADPRVELSWPGSVTRELAVAGPRSADDVAALRYTYRYQAAGNEPELLASLVVSMTDAAGNGGREVVPSLLDFDFSAPALLVEPVQLVVEGPGASPVAPSGLTVGSRLSVLALLDERVSPGSRLVLAAPASPAAPCPPTGVLEAPAASSSTDSALRFEVGLAAGARLPDGRYRVCLLLEDLAGNGAALEVGSVEVDTQPPPDPDVDTRSAVVHSRAPWGDPAGPEPRYAVSGAAGSAAGATLAVVYGASGDGSRGERLAWGAVAADGSFGPIALPSPDRNQVLLELWDDAGNASALRRVRTGRFVAALAGKKHGDLFSNPHRVVEQPWAPPTLGEGEGSELADEKLRPGGAGAAALDAADGVGVEVGGLLAWHRARSATEMPAGSSQGMGAWDGDRGRGLIYGGLGAAGLSDAMFEIAGQSLTRLYPATSDPGPLAGAGMVYHAGLDAVLLFGGIGYPMTSGELLWRWTGREWVRVEPGPAPAGLVRMFPSIAYDPDGDRLIVAGGCADGDCKILLGDAWSWDQAQGWQQLTVPAAFSPRLLAAAAWDEVNREVVLFGGFAQPPPGNACTSETECVAGVERCTAGFCQLRKAQPVTADPMWGIKGTVWSQRTPAGPMPSPRGLTTLASVPGKGIYLYGGATAFPVEGPCDAATCRDDLWRWDGAAWQDLGPQEPGLQGGLVLLHDRASDELLLLGSSPELGTAANDELWIYSLASQGWRLAAGGASMMPRKWHALAFDDARRELTTFGGSVEDGAPARCDGAPGEFCDGMWSWNGLVWEPRAPQAGSPLPDGRSSPGLAAGVGGDLFVYGGCGATCDVGQGWADFWRWRDSAWELLCGPTTTPCPPGPVGPAPMAYDTKRSLLFMLGGVAPGPAALWSSLQPASPASPGAWTLRCGAGCAGPKVREGASLVYHPLLDRVLLVGGFESVAGKSQLLDEVWAWDEATGAWESLCAACGLPAREFAAVYDPNRARVLVWAGERSGDLLELDGGRVAAVGWSTSPGILKHSAMGLDPDRHEILVNGGTHLSDRLSDQTWTVDVSPAARPALLFDFDWRSAGVLPSAAWGVSAAAVAGGTGYGVDLSTDAGGDDTDLVGSPIDGAVVQAWDAAGRAWVSLASGGFAATTPSTFAGGVEQPGAFVHSSHDRLFVRVVPAAGRGNGPGAAKLVLDHLAVTVDYQLALP